MNTETPFRLNIEFLAEQATRRKKTLLDHLEDEFAEYRHAVELRLTPNDPSIHAQFKLAIENAREAAK